MKLILNIYEIFKMKKTTSLLIFLMAVFQLLSCSLPENNNSQSSMPENKPINSMSESKKPSNEPANIADEDFAKEWRSKFEATSDQLERNRRLWMENKIVNYDFVFGSVGGGVTSPHDRSPVLIKIREGEVNSMDFVSKGYASKSGVQKIDGYEDFDTIDKLFNYMRQELEKKKIIFAKYNKKFGYPEEIVIIFTRAVNHNGYVIQSSKFKIIR